MQQDMIVRFGSPELELLTAHVKALEEIGFSLEGIAAASNTHTDLCNEIVVTLKGIAILLEHLLAPNDEGERAGEANAPKGGGSDHERA